MINVGLLRKTFYELWPTTALFATLLFVFEALVAYVLPLLEEQYPSGLMQMSFVQAFIQAMLGAEVPPELSPMTFSAFAWAHPVILALVWGHPAICCTRVPAGEIDCGTIDILLSLPVGRWQILCNETLVWLIGGAVVLVALAAGNWYGRAQLDDALELPWANVMCVLTSLACLYLAVGGLCYLVAAALDRRGVAITIVFSFLLGSFLLNYLARLWEPAERLAFLSPMHYYRPLAVLQEGVLPGRDIAVLLTAAATTWIAAGIVFARRDVCTV